MPYTPPSSNLANGGTITGTLYVDAPGATSDAINIGIGYLVLQDMVTSPGNTSRFSSNVNVSSIEAAGKNLEISTWQYPGFAGSQYNQIVFAASNSPMQFQNSVQSTNPQTSAPTITSGTAFSPSINSADVTLSFQVNAATAGSFTVTFGPSTGSEHTLYSAVAVVAGHDVPVAFRVPGGWQVIVTLSGTTLSNAFAYTV